MLAAIQISDLAGNSFVITAVVSAVLIPLVSLLKKEHWPDQLKFAISLVISILVGAATTVLTYKTFTWAEFVAHISVAVASMQTLYRLYFSGSPWDKYLGKVGSTVTKTGTDISNTVVTDPAPLEPPVGVTPGQPGDPINPLVNSGVVVDPPAPLEPPTAS